MTEPSGGTRHRIGPPSGFRLRRRLIVGLALFVVLALFLVPWLASTVTDWWWFQSVGFQPVFLTGLTARLLLFLIGGFAAFGFLYSNFWWAWRRFAGVPALYVSQSGQAVDFSLVIPRLVRWGTLFIAFVMGLVASAQWLDVLMALHGVAVGERDPLFGRDIGFYLFRLPVISGLLGALAVLTVLAIVGVLLLYTVRGAVNVRARTAGMQPAAARHTGALLVLLFLVFAVQLWLVDASSLLYSTTGPFTGASYADVHVKLPGIRISAVAAVLAAGLVAYGIVRQRLVGAAVLAFAGYAVVSVVARGIAPSAEEKFVVAPSELALERPYLRRHIAATRRAWRIDSVATRDLDSNLALTMADVRADTATIENVRLWERDLLQQTLSQLQEIRTYYDFVSVTDDRYVIDGRYRQVHVSARELNPASLPTRNFINERLTFTHGMGIAMAPVNQVTPEGLPVLFVKDLPPASTVSIKVTRPQIYYGELTNSYVFVGTGQREFDYPAADSTVYTTYAGPGGVPVGSFARRALYAWQLGSTDVMLSSYLGRNARILYRRNILDRAQTVLPFLQFDGEPYLVVTDSGALKWMLDAYTSSSRWPYAQPVSDGTNYMRNSVKVVIDAYDGSVDAYLADPADPVARTYLNVFGPIIKPMSAMPTDLRRHLRYPGDLFRVQTSMYATYHMVDPDAFYHREDQWQYPAVERGTPNTTPFMRHIILSLPGETRPEFIYMTPFTPRGKDNLAAWMAARMDAPNYGKLVVYQFPKQSLVYGPRQIANRIDQETSISQQLSLWDQKGSQVLRGELLVIPIAGSLIYVQPLYLRAQGGSIPELKRVIVARANRVAMAETLDQGLAALFGAPGATSTTLAAADTTTATQPATTATSAIPADLLREAQQHYERAIAAQRAGDWATYGREIDQLGAVLERLQPVRP